MKKRLTFLAADTSPRVLLFFFAILLQLIASGVSGVGFSLNGVGFWIAGMALWLLWFGLMFLIVTPRTDALLQRCRGWLKRGASVIFFSVLIVGIVEAVILGFFVSGFLGSDSENSFAKVVGELHEGFQYNDGTALSQQAAENLLDGKNPYAHTNVVEALIKFNGTYDRVTPLRLGRFADVSAYPSEEQLKQLWDSAVQNPSQPPPELETQVCYPAGSFLLIAPFVAAGIKDIRFIYFIFVIAGLAFAAWRLPGKKRLLFIGAAVISLELWNTIAVGETGIIAFPLLLIAWVTLGRNIWVSAVFMGLAVATKQNSWFFLPFYLILLWRTSSPKAAAGTLGIIAAVFIAINGYFIAKGPELWLQSITSPMTQPMFPLGIGLVSLVNSGLINIQTSLPFTVMELIVLIGGIIWYFRNCRQYPDTGLILAILPLFFAWRSLWTYFFYVTLIILAGMLVRGKANPNEPIPTRVS